MNHNCALPSDLSSKRGEVGSEADRWHRRQNDAGQSHPPCDVCETILRELDETTSSINQPAWPGTELSLGTVTDILRIDCSAHRSLLSAVLPRGLKRCDGSRIQLSRHKRGSYVFIHGGSGSIPWMLSNRNPQISYRGPGRIVDLEWIDIKLVQTWISTCDVRHGRSCRSAYETTRIAQYRPNMLIDTWHKCLTKTTAAESYIALSYVWGNTPNLKTIKDNVEVFKQPGGLGREEIACRIPKTIRDAIAFTELLQERYLWVDSLCIVQDDEKTSYSEITRMASIYANATLTIIAASGEDANHGLRGIRGILLPRSHPQRTARLPNGAEIIERNLIDSIALGRSSWSRRGWTFQESLFSQRKLIFGEHSTWWDCRSTNWDEDVESPHCPQTDTAPSFHESKNFSITWPDLMGYHHLVYDFNRRDFTYPEDIIDAFSGVTTPLSVIFHGGFLYGLPELFFDVALLWRAGAGESQMERRIPGRQGTKSKLPSWSWMGWKGAIDPDSWHGGDDYLKMILHGRSSVRTSPLVKWYVHGKEKGFKRQIRSIWSKYGDHCYSDHGTEIPVGWERYDYYPDTQELYRAKENPEYHRIQKYFFKHISDNCTEFWYPITISQAATVPQTLSHLPFISCHTSRCWLAGAAKFQKWTCQWDLWVPLRDGAGDWAGILNLHYINPASDPSFPPPTQYELIAISTGYASSWSTKINGKLSRMWDLEIPESRHAGFPCTKRYEFINVLWIEWEDGIAYRKSVGRVEKHMWEAQSLEWIDVTLG